MPDMQILWNSTQFKQLRPRNAPGTVEEPNDKFHGPRDLLGVHFIGTSVLPKHLEHGVLHFHHIGIFTLGSIVRFEELFIRVATLSEHGAVEGGFLRSLFGRKVPTTRGQRLPESPSNTFLNSI